MKLPNAASVALIVALITVITSFIQTTYPGSSYVWAPLVVGLLTVVGKWLQEWMIDKRTPEAPPASPSGVSFSVPPGQPAPPPVSRLRRVMLG